MPLVVLLISTVGFMMMAGPLASIVALIIGYDTRRKMQRGQISKANVGLLKAGMILGYVGVAILAIMLVFIAFLAAAKYRYSH